MNFIIGMLISAGLLLCIMFEMLEVVRPLFSVIFLGGIIAAIVYVIVIDLVNPWFIFGFVLNLLLFFPVIRDSKEDKK